MAFQFSEVNGFQNGACEKGLFCMEDSFKKTSTDLCLLATMVLTHRCQQTQNSDAIGVHWFWGRAKPKTSSFHKYCRGHFQYFQCCV